MIWFLAARAEAADQVILAHPLPHEVIQRDGTATGAGHADVVIAGALPKSTENCNWTYRVVAAESAAESSTAWQSMTIERDGDLFRSTVRVAAGGWYRLEMRGNSNDAVRCEGSVEPIGVGEVFLVAGQSYATNTNDERHNVLDAQRRVVAFDSSTGAWRAADDPQPTPDNSDGGSIWPPLGDALAAELKVPIGFANVAWGGTASAQWLPGEQLYLRLEQTGQTLGRFRAVLWQQGESDVIGQVSTEQYVANLVRIRTAAAEAWGFQPCWLLAKSTHHPTVYNDPQAEGRIRAADDKLVELPGFCAGPDTDSLQGENRGDVNSRRHFSAIGQKRAAELWRAAIAAHLLTQDAAAP